MWTRSSTRTRFDPPRLLSGAARAGLWLTLGVTTMVGCGDANDALLGPGQASEPSIAGTLTLDGALTDGATVEVTDGTRTRTAVTSDGRYRIGLSGFVTPSLGLRVRGVRADAYCSRGEFAAPSGNLTMNLKCRTLDGEMQGTFTVAGQPAIQIPIMVRTTFSGDDVQTSFIYPDGHTISGTYDAETQAFEGTSGLVYSPIGLVEERWKIYGGYSTRLTSDESLWLEGDGTLDDGESTIAAAIRLHKDF